MRTNAILQQTNLPSLELNPHPCFKLPAQLLVMHPKNSEAVDSKSAPPQEQFPEGQWTTGLYDCCDDPSNCLTTCLCPCVTFGKIAEIIDRGDRSCGLSGLVYYAMVSIHCGWFYSGIYRTKLRQLFSLPEAPCADKLVHGCCCVCSLSQEYRELKNRGADPSIGWQANVEKWKKEGLKPPIATSGMER